MNKNSRAYNLNSCFIVNNSLIHIGHKSGLCSLGFLGKVAKGSPPPLGVGRGSTKCWERMGGGQGVDLGEKPV